MRKPLTARVVLRPERMWHQVEPVTNKSSDLGGELEEFVRISYNQPRRKSFLVRNFSLLLLSILVLSAVLTAKFLTRRHGAFYSVSPVLDTQLLIPQFTAGQPSQVRVVARKQLDDLLVYFGVEREQAVKVEAALREVSSANDYFKQGAKVELRFDPQGELLRVTTFTNPADRLVLDLTPQKINSWFMKEAPVEVEQLVVGEIEGSFSSAARGAGLPNDLIDDIVDLFGNRINFNRDFRRGDRFSILLRELNGDSKGTVILAAALEVNKEVFVSARFVGTDGKARYFDERGKPLGNEFLRYPLKFSRISSTFADSRFHPVLRRSRPHNGVDFAAPVGTPVRTVADGRVIFAGYRGPAGNMVKIRHNERFTTEYFHLSKINPGITKGKLIAKGETIGAVGSTGLSTGPHLHYGLFDRGKYVNPLTAKLPVADKLRKGQTISRNYLNKVLFTLKHYQTMKLAKL